MGEKQKTSNEYCKQCKFYYGVAPQFKQNINTPAQPMCGYYGMTGKRRGCKVGECDKFELQVGKRDIYDDEYGAIRKRLIRGW